MKTIGIIGGMSWESTALYYKQINELVKARLGGLHSARILLTSVDFHEIEALQAAGNWAEAGRILAREAKALEAGGADFILIATNTMHLVAADVEAAVSIALLHIADATGACIQAAGVKRVGLLGTGFTMEQAFYKNRITGNFGIDVLVPDAAGRADVHRIIYEELCLGVVKDDSRDTYKAVIASLVAAGAEAIILGCTEIGMLVSEADAPVPLFDTTLIHAESAVDYALKNGQA